MIGPGTGLAPFRGFLQDLRAKKAKGQELGHVHLFFGCQKASQHFLYKEELYEFLQSGALSVLHTAFSRDQEKKVYVQQRMREQAKAIWGLFELSAHIYVCGDGTKMSRDVHKELIAMAQEHGGKTEQQAIAYFKNLQQLRRYQQDVWS